uniref:Uncharacterized protein n=1 Tax=Arundo donax TaxID=35708 RepID=A0A0A8Z112_ARUDO
MVLEIWQKKKVLVARILCRHEYNIESPILHVMFIINQLSF